SEPLPWKQIQYRYADFVAAQQQFLCSSRCAESLDYWKQQLHSVPDCIQLPMDAERPARQTFSGESYNVCASQQLTDQLNAFAKQHKVTLYSVLMAAYQVLLFRISGQDDFVVGAPMSGRTSTQYEDLLGYFVNPMPIRAQLDASMTFADLLGTTSHNILATLDHQQLPFANLLDALELQRNPQHSPLFQVGFVLQSMAEAQEFAEHMLRVDFDANVGASSEYGYIPSTEAVEFGDLSITPIALPQQEGLLDLMLEVLPGPKGLLLAFKYNSDLFSSATIRAWSEQFLTLLHSIVAQPHARLVELPVLSTEERQCQLALSAGPEKTVHSNWLLDGFLEQAIQNPNGIALVHGQESLSYQQLLQQSKALAGHLQAAGTSQGDVVGLCAERSLEMMVGLYAILLAGAVYLPLDPDLPEQRLHDLLDDGGPQTVLVQSRHLSCMQRITAGTTNLVRLSDRFLEEHAAQAPAYISVALSAKSLAYILYTSGSTGKPKGVMISHEAIVNRLEWMQFCYQLQYQERVLHKTPISFDVSIWELFWPLRVGATLVLADPGGHKDGVYLEGLIRKQNISTVHFVPAMLRSFLETAPIQKGGYSLSRIICSGENLERSLAEKANELLAAPVHNLYGPTEAAVDVTWWAYDGESQELAASEVKAETKVDQHFDSLSIPIGIPIDNTQTYILNEALQLVPVGAIGELYLGGVNLAHGYHERPELTAASFIPSPFSGQGAIQSGARLYRTGDRVRRLTNGALEYLGRNDGQVKIRGQRIELGEVEAVLSEHPRVQAAAARVWPSPSGVRLAVYFTLKQNNSDNQDSEKKSFEDWHNELSHWLAQRVTAAMLPDSWTHLDEMPLSSSGKVNRKTLPEPDNWNIPGEGRAHMSAPQGVTEQLLAQIWSEVLGHDEIFRQDNFFQLGGHSLLAAQVVARVRVQLLLEMPLALLFDYPELFKQAEQLQILATESANSDKKPAKIAIAVNQLRADYPLSSAQQRLWVLQQMQTDSTAYNMPGAVRIKGPLNLQKLQQALLELMQRQQILGAYVELSDNLPVLRQFEVNEALLGSLFETFSCEGVAEVERAACLTQHVQELAAHVFALDGTQEKPEPLFKIRVLRFAVDDFALVICLHHLIADGWSLPILFKEWSDLYRITSESRGSQKNTEQTTLLAELPLQYRDFALWQQQEYSQASSRAGLIYWQQQLAGINDLHLLPDAFIQAETTTDSMYRFILPMNMVQGIQVYAKENGLTPFMVLLGLFWLLLNRHSQQQNFAVAIPVAGRIDVDLEPLIGCFVNTLLVYPVAVDQSLSEMGNDELLDNVRQSLLAGLKHQDIPFDMVVDALLTDRVEGMNPLAQALFTFQDDGFAKQLFGQPLSDWQTHYPAGKNFAVCLNIEPGETDQDWSACFEFDQELLSLQRVVEFSKDYLALISELLTSKHPADTAQAKTISNQMSLPLDFAAEPKDILPIDYAERVYQQTQSNQQQVALISDEAVISYSELEELVSALQNYLEQHGLHQGGVLVSHTSQLFSVVVMLAAERCGACWLPLVLDAGGMNGISTDVFSKTQSCLIISDECGWQQLKNFVEKNNTCLPQCRALSVNENWWSGLTVSELEMAKTGNGPSSAKGEPLKSQATSLSFYNVVADEHYSRQELQSAINKIMKDECQSLRAESRFFSLLPINSFVRCAALWTALSQGASVLLHARKEAFGQKLLNHLQHQKVTHLWVSHTQMSHMQAMPIGKQLPLQNVYVSGDYVLHAQAQRFVQQWQIVLTNIVTVAGGGIPISVRKWLLNSNQAIDFERIKFDFGEPFFETQWALLGRSGQLVPNGTAAKLQVGSEYDACLFRPTNYLLSRWRDPVEQHKQSAHQAHVWQYTGRVDQQIWRNGHYIDSLALLNYCYSRPDIQQVVIASYDADKASEPWMMYVASNTLQQSDESALLAELRTQFPAYMLVDRIAVLAVMPLLSDGEINHSALPVFEQKTVDESDSSTALTQTERTLRTLWQNLLLRDSVALEDNFFSIGGHSLAAAQLVSKINEQLNWRIKISDIFNYPTISSLINHQLTTPLDQQTVDATAVSITPLTLGDVKSIEKVEKGQKEASNRFHLSPAQQDIWMQCQKTQDHSAYHIPALFQVDGPLDLQCLQLALDKVLQRHEILRTIFTATVDGAMQTINSDINCSVKVIDCKGKNNNLNRLEGTELFQQMQMAVSAPFDVTQAPLVRINCYQQAEQSNLLLFVFHHLIFDGHSLLGFLDQLATEYAIALNNQGSNSQGLNKLGRNSTDSDIVESTHNDLQYKDYVHWITRKLSSPAADESRQFWHQTLANIEPLEFTHQRQRTSQTTADSSWLTTVIDSKSHAGLLASLRSLAAELGISVFMLNMAALYVAFYRMTGQNHITLGTVASTRTENALDDMMGLFLNNLALPFEVKSDQSFVDIIKEIKPLLLTALQHADYPMGQLVEELLPETAAGHMPFFDVLIDWQDGCLTKKAWSLADAEVESVGLLPQQCKYDLTLYFRDNSECLQFDIEYRSALYSHKTIQQFNDAYLLLLQQIVVQPERALIQLPLVCTVDYEDQLLLSHGPQKA
ncbi:MAG: amino acid adenylation domain-containing protein, partial [Arenicella sp.]